jgi:hypothetical protein
VLFLWSQNVGETSLGDVAEPLLILIGAAALVTVVLGSLLRDRRRAALIVTPLVLGGLLYGHVADLVEAPDAVRTAGWAALVLVGLVAAIRLGARRLATVDTALARLGLVFVIVPLITIVPVAAEQALRPPPPVLAGGRTLPSETDAERRDVYWIVLDRYGSDRSFELQFGVRNPFTPWLREQGFQVLDDSHANYAATSLSLATTLNLAHLEELTGLEGSTSPDYRPVYARLQSSQAVLQFKALGYRHLHLGSWWNPTRTDEAADENFNADGINDFTAVLIEHTIAPTVVETFGLEGEPPTEPIKHLKHNRYALDQLDRLPSQPGPTFVFAHILLPHPPYVFDRDGRYMPPAEVAAIGDDEAWERQLTYTNARLQRFIEGLLAAPEEDRPIIILQADEGPWTDGYASDKVGYDWATASPEELEIKFGILNAWYVPGDVDLGLEPDVTAINTFPILFGRYFGLEGYELLPDRVTASRGWDRPYQLIDITDRLPSLR